MAASQQQLVTYREMRGSDLDSVMRIETDAYALPWSVGIFRDCLTAGYDCRVLCLNENIVGHAILSAAAGEAHLLNICVQPEQQGQGLGRSFVRHVIDRAAERGAAALYLEVRPSNKRAVRLYESLGFCQIGVRKGYYPGNPGNPEEPRNSRKARNPDSRAREDALVLALQISPAG